MSNDDSDGFDNDLREIFSTTVAERMGKEVARVREQVRGWSGSELSRRCSDAGYPITRFAISKIENNQRGGKFGVDEWLVLSLALGVPPAQLLFPDLPEGDVRVVPWHTVNSTKAVRWLVGRDDPTYAKPAETSEDRREFLNRLGLSMLVSKSVQIGEIRSRRKEAVQQLKRATDEKNETLIAALMALIEQYDQQIEEAQRMIDRPQSEWVRREGIDDDR